MAKAVLPAVEGWFTMDEAAPCLLGTRCTACATYYFPPLSGLCRNPHCDSFELEPVELSRRGRIWSYTDAQYQPPPPFVAADPYVPYGVCAVELNREQMVVMGQVVPGVGVDRLSVGAEVEVVLDTLYEDDDARYLVWKWRPIEGAQR